MVNVTNFHHSTVVLCLLCQVTVVHEFESVMSTRKVERITPLSTHTHTPHPHQHHHHTHTYTANTDTPPTPHTHIHCTTHATHTTTHIHCAHINHTQQITAHTHTHHTHMNYQCTRVCLCAVHVVAGKRKRKSRSPQDFLKGASIKPDYMYQVLDKTKSSLSRTVRVRATCWLHMYVRMKYVCMYVVLSV